MAHIARLFLQDFRNYAQSDIEAAAGLVVLAGDNGAGKTNILEALSLFAPGRGLRGAPLVQMARQGGSGGFALSARLDAGDGGALIEMGTGITAAATERRQVRIGGAQATANSLGEWLSLIWLTPAQDRLFTETASARRRFLDRLVLALEPTHATHVSRYEAAMRARSRLLSEDTPADPQWLAALERHMADHGAAAAAARRSLVRALDAACAAGEATDFPRSSLRLAGDEDMAAEAMADLLAKNRARDAAAGRATWGPHRVDLEVFHREKGQMAALCSTGEQKALLVGLILAHGALVAKKKAKKPLFLLDEVAAHLDARRREALFHLLSETGAQAWMTGTDRALFAGAPAAQFWAVDQGQIRPA